MFIVKISFIILLQDFFFKRVLYKGKILFHTLKNFGTDSCDIFHEITAKKKKHIS